MLTNGLALGLLLVASGCHAPPKPPVVAGPPLPLPPPEAPPAPPLPAPARVPANWSFATGSAGCAAQAAADAGGFGISVQSGGMVYFTVSGGTGTMLPLTVGQPVPISFQGPAGSWTLPGAVRSGSAVRARAPAGDEALGMVLAVLGGGTASAGDVALGLPEIEIPPAGPAGSSWFPCARKREHG
ncbi:MAG: hypothetical protein ACREFJ_12410 [Acetobacteraceae bacterium]